MKPAHFVKILASILLVGLSSNVARADGGIIRLRETQGPFVVTIFTTSEPVQDCPADISILVQRQDSSDAILDANVNLVFTAPAASVAKPVEEMCGMSGAASGTNVNHFTVAATRQQASNKLLYAAPVKFGTAGDWQLQAFIERGDAAVKIACAIPVGSPPRRLTGLLPYLVLPPVMVALFAINQCLRKQSLEKNIT
jgi:hypothetical protein